MYPIADFRTVGLRAARRTGFAVLAFIGTLALFVLTALDLSDPWGAYDPTRRILLVWGTITAAGLTLACEVAAKLARHPYTRCPHCRGRLADHVPLVVAGGCCPHCGLRVLDPPAADPPPDALIPRADFIASDSSYQNRVVPIAVAGVIAIYLGCGGAALSLERLRLAFPLNWVLFLTLLLIAPVSLAVVLRWFTAGGKRNPALACPACGKLLAGARMLVAGTGHCCLCGGRAITSRVRPLAPPHLARPWTIPRLAAVEKLRGRYTWRMLILVGLVLATTAGLIVLVNRLWDEARLRKMGLSWWTAGLVDRGGKLAIGLGGLGVSVVVARGMLRLARRKHPLDCPRCGRELLPTFARATRCCNRCGWTVVATSSPPAA